MHLLPPGPGAVCGEDLRSPAGPDRPPCDGAVGGVRGHAPPGDAGVLGGGEGPGGRGPGHSGGAPGGVRRGLQRPDRPGAAGNVLPSGRRRGGADEKRLSAHGPDGPVPRPDSPGGPDHRRPGRGGGHRGRPPGRGDSVPEHGHIKGMTLPQGQTQSGAGQSVLPLPFPPFI